MARRKRGTARGGTFYGGVERQDPTMAERTQARLEALGRRRLRREGLRPGGSCAPHEHMNTTTRQKALFGHSLLHSENIREAWPRACVKEEHKRVASILETKYGVTVRK